MIPQTFLAFVLISIIALVCADISPKRAHLLDYNVTSNTYIFRGNIPLINSNFVPVDVLLSEILEPAFEKEKLSSNHTFHHRPEDVYLVDISFLASLLPKDHSALKTEREFFEKNPNQGEFIHWTVYGHLVNASSLSESVRHQAIKHTPWDFDSLRERIPQLNRWVRNGFTSPLKEKNAPNKKIVVFYIHCAAGVDRTGEVSGSYMMEFKHTSFLDVLKFDYSVGDRPIASYSENALTWYCWHLYYDRKFPTDCDAWLPRDKG